MKNTRHNVPKRIFAALIAAAFAVITACAQTPSATTTAKPANTAVPAQATGEVDGDQYIIGPGDTIQVFVWRNPELSVTVPVRPDGKISTPLVEDMTAVGKTPTRLARDIETVLSEYVRTPQVNIIVSNALSAFSQVKVVGQVKVPQAVPYRDGMRVLDVLLLVGGVTDFASANRSRIVRQENGKTKEIRVKLGALLERGDMRQNFELRPGDVLVVPQSIF
ncbi:MAG: polysaccharide export protein [Pseudomonadales bacterium]|nr:polysaccharide export protein [Pseudomonadales bacterium]